MLLHRRHILACALAWPPSLPLGSGIPTHGEAPGDEIPPDPFPRWCGRHAAPPEVPGVLLIKYVIKSNIRVKQTTGGAGGQPPVAGGGEARGAKEAMNEGKGQLVTLTGGLARGPGRRALTAAEFQGLLWCPPRPSGLRTSTTRGRDAPTGSTSTTSWGSWGSGSPRSSVPSPARRCSPGGRTWRGGAGAGQPSGASSRRSLRSLSTSVMQTP